MSASAINTGLIGLAARAGKLVSGSEASQLALKANQAKLIIIDEGVSPGTLNEFQHAAETRGIAIICLAEGVLGQVIGKPGRKVAAVKDDSFAHGIIKSWRENE